MKRTPTVQKTFYIYNGQGVNVGSVKSANRKNALKKMFPGIHIYSSGGNVTVDTFATDRRDASGRGDYAVSQDSNWTGWLPIKKNPAAKKSIKRKSQVTGKPPGPRLLARRKTQAKKPVKGYFPNPLKYMVERRAVNSTVFKPLASFASRESASAFAHSLAKNSALWVYRIRTGP